MSVPGKRAEKPPKKAKPNGAEPPPEGETVATEAASPETENEQPVDRPNNTADLTDEQLFALSCQWANRVVAKEEERGAAKSKYDGLKSDCRNLLKKVKAELGDDGLDRVKLIVKIRRDENAVEQLRATLRNSAWVAKWMNATPGQQLEIFPDLRPIDDRAYEEGKAAGLAGDRFNPTFGMGTEAYHRFQDGWQAGQEILTKGFKPLEKMPEDLGEPKSQAEPEAPAAD
jgi:hypothetical protein